MQENLVAVMRLSALGDLILMLPLIHRLVDAGIEPHWIISKNFAPLFRALSGVKLVEIDKPRSVFDYKKNYELLGSHNYMALLATQANLRVNLLYPAVKTKRKIGFDSRRARDGQWLFVSEQIAAQRNHLCDGFLQFADVLGVPKSTLKWGLPVDENAKSWALERMDSQGWIAINPSASKSERNWSIQSYIEIIRRILEKGSWKVVLTGGASEAEVGLAKSITDQLPLNSILNLVGQTSLNQLVGVLSQVEVVVAPDTGPVHIANALGKPVVGLYAVAPSWLVGPHGQNQYVVDKYDEAVRHFLGKDPSQLPLGARVHHSGAMDLISVDEVWQKLCKLI